MFLLNLKNVLRVRGFSIIFTSHYVPIKSDRTDVLKIRDMKFTSHYVPIKSIELMC